MFDENEIISRVLHKDLRAFEILVKQYERLVFHVVGRLVHNYGDTQDICQEVFIKVHKNLGSFEFKSKLSTWIAKIAYLTAINYLKKYRNSGEDEVSEDMDKLHFTNEHPESVLEKKDTAAYVNMLIDQLPEQYRIVLTLYHLNEFSYQEIEDITEMPEGTIKSYLFRGRKLLKEKLEVYLKSEWHERV